MSPLATIPARELRPGDYIVGAGAVGAINRTLDGRILARVGAPLEDAERTVYAARLYRPDEDVTVRLED